MIFVFNSKIEKRTQRISHAKTRSREGTKSPLSKGGVGEADGGLLFFAPSRLRVKWFF